MGGTVPLLFRVHTLSLLSVQQCMLTRLGGRKKKEAPPPPLFASHDGEQPDDAYDKQDQYYQRVGAQVKELAFGAEDEAVEIDGCQEHTQASQVDIAVFGLWEDGLP